MPLRSVIVPRTICCAAATSRGLYSNRRTPSACRVSAVAATVRSAAHVCRNVIRPTTTTRPAASAAPSHQMGRANSSFSVSPAERWLTASSTPNAKKLAIIDERP